MTLLTEEEAKTKWCPLVRVAEAQAVGDFKISLAINRDVSLGEKRPRFKCIASSCMMWRKMPRHNWNNQLSQWEVQTNDTGFCGLAGKPEVT